MSNVRLSRSLCAVVGSVLAGTGSHTTLDALFKSAGAPGAPPDLAHYSKWKEWLFRAGQDSSVDSLAVLAGFACRRTTNRGRKPSAIEDVRAQSRAAIDPALMIWSLDRELDGDRPEWGRHAALKAGGWTQVTKPLTNPVRFTANGVTN